MGETSGLPASQGRERVSSATSLDTLHGIALRGRDLSVMGHHSLNHQWDMRRRSLFLLTPAWARGTSINPRVLHKHLLFRKWATRARAWVEVEDRLSGRDFRDLRACLCHDTSDLANRSVDYSRYVYTLAPMGKSIVRFYSMC